MADNADAPTDENAEQQEPPEQGDSGQQPKPEAPSKTFDQATVDKIVADRLERERKKYADYGDLKKASDELAKLKDAEKTESQRLNDQLAEREVELQELRVEKIRNNAGQTAKLDPEMWEFITSSDPAEALAQAKRLAERLTPPDPAKADLRQGSRAPAKTPPSANDLLRGMAGHQ